MNRARGLAPVATVVVVLVAVATAGVAWVAIGADLSQGASTATTSGTDLQTADTATESDSNTSESKDVTVVIEHWNDSVGIAINGGPDADAITAVRIEGATMESSMALDSDYPKAVGTVTGPTTVRVIATFEDGTEQVIGERRID